MKKIIVVLLVAFAALSCQQKQEPKPEAQRLFPPVQDQNQIRQLQEIAARDPKNPNAWTQLGNVLMDSGRFQEAIDAYQKTLALDEKNADVRVDMGVCYRNIGKPDIAVAEFKKALAFHPDHITGHKNLAVVLENDLHDYAQAAKEFQKVLDLDPNTPDAERIRQEIQKLKAAGKS